MADIIYAIRPAYCLFSLTRCLQPKQPSTDGERQAQLLDDDTSPLGLALSAGVHPFFISVHGSMIACRGSHPRVAVAFAGFIIGTASKPATQPAAVARALSPKHPCCPGAPLARPRRATSLAFGPGVFNTYGFRSQRRSS